MGFYWLNHILQFIPDAEISKSVNLILGNIKVSSFEDISRLEPNDFVYGIIFDTPFGPYASIILTFPIRLINDVSLL